MAVSSDSTSGCGRADIEGNGVLLTYLSKDGEEGYPGNLTATVRYRVVRNELRVEYGAPPTGTRS